MENSPKSQVVERLRDAQNVLVTVSANPSVDQLSAAIGFTLMMNKLGKHATAVFSGQVPSTIEFLKPESTLESNTNSLRDFIIALDKSKADKLRYKVEDDYVKIFITPYRTSLSADDLNFSQGDFNVDVVMALGVDQRDHVDQAILEHGRILHDATVIGVMAGDTQLDVGSINWQDQSASSLCEMLVSISEAFQSGLLDEQMATAFLTGIVAETERFSNQKTSPKVMTMSAQLMAAGANQQLIATELTANDHMLGDLPAPVDADGFVDSNEAVLELDHDEGHQEDAQNDEQQIETHEDLAQAVNEVQKTAEDAMQPVQEEPEHEVHSKFLGSPPSGGPKLTANTEPESYEPSIDPLSAANNQGFNGGEHEKAVVSPLLGVTDDAESVQAASMPSTEAPLLPSDGETDTGEIVPDSDPNAEIPEAPSDVEADIPVIDKLGPEVKNEDTLEDIEHAVEDYSGQQPHSVKAEEPAQESPTTPAEQPPVESAQPPDEPITDSPAPEPELPQSQLSAEDARQAVLDAVNASGGYDATRPEPIQALNAQEFPVTESVAEQVVPEPVVPDTAPTAPDLPVGEPVDSSAPPSVPPPLLTNQFPIPGADVYEPDEEEQK